MTSTTPSLERTFWVTAVDGVDHAVANVDFAAGTREPARGFRAVCGQRFWAAPMIANPAPSCQRCGRYLAARATLLSVEERFGAVPTQWREWIVRRFLAAAMAVTPVSSPRPLDSGSAGEPPGRHARRDSNPATSSSEIRRPSDVARHARQDVAEGAR